MATQQQPDIEIREELLDALRSFPPSREIEHCGVRFSVSPFDFYAECPHCGVRFKVRSFGAVGEIEDVFDAVFTWMNQPMAHSAAQRRQQELHSED